MITAIGLMIGFYILMRYREMWVNDGPVWSTNQVSRVKLYLMITIVITCLCIFIIISKDISGPNF